MKQLSILTIFILLSFSLWSSTDIPAGQVNGNWTITGSPYLVNGDIEIIQGEQLIISESVVVTFTGHYQLTVNGQLLVNGTATNEILLSAQNAEAGWGGIRFIDGTDNVQDSSKVVYTILQNGNATGFSPDYRGGAIYANNSNDLLISHCTFIDNNANSSGGAIYLENSAAIIKNSIFAQNNSNGTGGAISLNNSDVSFSENNIYENTAVYDGGGIYCLNSDPIIYRDILSSNLTQWNGGGIAFYQNCSPTLDHVTIANNTAYQQGSGIACLYNTNAVVNNAIIWGNASTQIYTATSAEISVTYSVIQNAGSGDDFWGEGCINDYPIFATPIDNNYYLGWINYPVADSTKSPCIDTGDLLSATDIDGTRADMGANSFSQSGIQGTVSLVGTAGNVEDVIITAGAVTTYPDENGLYLINIAPGVYDITATLEGFSSDEELGIIVSANQTTTGVDFTLNQIIPGTIEGQVAIEGLGEVMDVTISAGEFTTSPLPIFEGDILVYYEYSLSIPAGTYDVTATLPGYQDSTITDVNVNGGLATTDINFSLDLITFEGTVSGNVSLYNNSGNVEDVVVSIGSIITNPDANGDYELEIVQGTYSVQAVLDGHATVSLNDIEVVANTQTDSVDFVLMNWDVINGTQFTMIGNYTFTKSDGSFFEGTDNNQIAAFGPDGNGGYECRGIGVWQTGNWMEWALPYDIPGYWYFTLVSYNNSGENIYFKVLEQDESTMILHEQTDLSSVIFEDNLHMKSHLEIYTDVVEQEFDLMEEWNWISFNLYPSDPNIDVVCADLVTDMVEPDLFQLKNQTQSTSKYEGSEWGGGLTIINPIDGYLMCMPYNYNDFVVTGRRLNPVISIIPLFPYENGYNWIGYTPNEPIALEDAIGNVSENLWVVKTQTESAINNNGVWIGDLTTMQPGKSYKVQVDTSLVDTLLLVYPDANALGTETRNLQKSNFANWEIQRNTKSNMIYLANISFENDALVNDANYSVGIFDAENNCRSIGIENGNYWYFTIVGNTQDEELSIKIWDNENHQFVQNDGYLVFAEDTILGSVKDPISVRADKNSSNVQPQIILNQNYPNPFNPSTTIEYYLSEKSHVNISVFNIVGQKIETLENSNIEAGHHSIVWNASKYSSGIYFYKIETPHNTLTKKSILLK